MIGLFDSGVGGLSVLKALVQNNINDDFVYFGDTKNMPYGTKTKEEILTYTKEIIEFFINKHVDVAIMACNTSSALVYKELNSEFSNKIKLFPLIQHAAPYFKNENEVIGVISTNATAKSQTYTKEIMKLNKDAKIVELPCQDFVQIVEKRLYDDISSVEYIKEKMEYLKNTKCKKVILGCTHFPYLVPIFKKFAPEIEFIDPANFLIQSLKDFTQKEKTNSTFKFYVSDNPENFKKSGSIFFDIKEDVSLIEFAKI